MVVAVVSPIPGNNTETGIFAAMEKSLFIAFEGIDGSGKSTQVKLLAERLRAKGQKVYSTFEPTNSRIGSIIRDIFRHRMEADHRTIAALYVADRLHHLLNGEDGILSKLEEGYTVLTDRYYFSSYAYQGSRVPMDWVITANSLAAGLRKADYTFYVDISPEAGVERMKASREIVELFETLDDLKAVRDNYLEAFRRLGREENIITIDGMRPPGEVAEAIWQQLPAGLRS